MVSFYKRFYFLKIYENWFHYQFRISDLFSLNAFLVIKSPTHKKKWGIKKITHTVENPLTEDIDVIFSGFSSTVRNEIRKSEKEGVVCCFYEDIDNFVDFYNSFAVSRRIPTTSRQRIVEMGENLKLSCALLNGEVLAVHSYLVDREIGIARLFHSASLRFSNIIDISLIGRSNKLLHFKDMLYFKEMGFTLYDFGGYTENSGDNSLIGINKFKLSFGGQVTTCLNYYSVSYFVLKTFQRLIFR